MSSEKYRNPHANSGCDCRRMLEEHGGRGVRMGDIAKAAGISRQAVYLHFAVAHGAAGGGNEVSGRGFGRGSPARAISSGKVRRRTPGAIYRLLGSLHSGNLWRCQGAYPGAETLTKRRQRPGTIACWPCVTVVVRQLTHCIQMATLQPEWTPKRATDALWTMLLVPNWENLTGECGWSTRPYVRWMKHRG